MLKKRLGIEGIERNWGWCYNLKNYYKTISTLIIPEGVKVIGYHAFDCYRDLRKVVIPGSVEVISPSAFYNCKELEEAIIPESVDWIGYEAFYDCSEAIIILRKRREDFALIGINAFKNCKDVKEEVRS